ncbi:GerAB/ArcD/ProY family transporter [Cohnella caldifontis]|uniref:GerAB/ArcD/ProY family transporter n=1 Tax=Cohnella caldifontis TaxID=3027471 RepID=UPI0023EC467D|nr:GerAB/ArcD/ProY family transporter [Cohnella sp. YIM B05605]
MQEKLSYTQALILLYIVQAGLVLFRFPQVEAQYFGSNGWSALLICFAASTLNILMVAGIYKLGQGKSVYDILERTIPRVLLFPVYFAVVAVWAMMASLAAKEYIHILKMVAFPTIHSSVFMIVLGLLAYYLYGKGIYSISKAAIVFLFLTVWMTLLLLFFFSDFRWSRLTPFLFREGTDYVKGFFNLYPAFLGYELSLVLFPYSDKKTKLTQAAFMANLYLTLLYVYVSIICFGVFHYNQLKHKLFPVLDLLAAVKFPFMERIENLFYGFFLFANIVTVAVYYWSAVETGLRIVPKMNRKLLGFVLIAAATGVAAIPDTLMETEEWLREIGYAGFVVSFGFPLILLAVLPFQRRKGKSGLEST